MNSGLQVYNEQAKLAQWGQIVSRCRGSGMSVRQWCLENGVNISSYYRHPHPIHQNPPHIIYLAQNPDASFLLFLVDFIIICY